jgi:hypothetical protein
MRKGIAIHGLSEETVQLIPLLEANPGVEICVVFDPDLDAARQLLRQLDPPLAASLEERLTDEPERLVTAEGVQAVVDAGTGIRFVERCATARERGLEVVSPLTARLLWGYGGGARDRKSELLQALHEVVDSVDLAVDTDELFERMLEIAISTIGAEQGSLMLLDTQSRELRIRVAVGVERELWAKIRVPLGEGIAGRVAADGRPLLLRGRADRQAYRIVRERGDVESAICVPLLHDGTVLGVINLSTMSRTDAFTNADLEFAEQLAKLDARIIARAQEHEALREKAARYSIARELGDVLQQRTPIGQRLQALCRYLAGRVGDGIASVYLFEEGDAHLQLAATSLAGGGFGTEYRVRIGEGLDGRVARDRRAEFLSSEDGAVAYAALPLLAADHRRRSARGHPRGPIGEHPPDPSDAARDRHRDGGVHRPIDARGAHVGARHQGERDRRDGNPAHLDQRHRGRRAARGIVARRNSSSWTSACPSTPSSGARHSPCARYPPIPRWRNSAPTSAPSSLRP